MPQRAFDVFQDGKEIDTIFYAVNDTISAEEVKDSLVNHDGYDPNIEVIEYVPSTDGMPIQLNPAQLQMVMASPEHEV